MTDIEHVHSMQEAAKVLGSAQMESSKSRAQLASTLSQHAAAKRGAARVQLVGTLVAAGSSPTTAMTTAKSFIPSPSAHDAAVPPLAPPSSAKASTRTSTEGTYTSPAKVSATVDLALSSPEQLPPSRVDYSARLLSGMTPQAVLGLSPCVVSSVRELAMHCASIKSVGDQVESFAAELKGAYDDRSVLAAMHIIKEKVQKGTM